MAMIAHDEKTAVENNGVWRARLWRYAPLVLWMSVIYFASTREMSASKTSLIIRPLLLWLFPQISESELNLVHSVVRKGAHVTEYAILALLAARAFAGSTHSFLRKKWLYATALLFIFYSLLDELHQSFVPSRTGSIYDSLIDMAGGLLGLMLYALWQRRRRKMRPV